MGPGHHNITLWSHISEYPSCLSPYVNKSVHMQCSAVTELVVDGNVTPESDVVVTRKRERSDDESEDVKKLQKEAEVKEERRVKLRKLRGMDSSQEEGGLASSQVAAVSVAPVSASNHGAGGQVEVDGNVTPESDVGVTRKRERSDGESEDVKKLQKEAEVKEEMRVKLRKLRGMDSSHLHCCHL